MKTICASGFKISNADKLGLEHYLAISPKQWARDALDGMINMAIKNIKKDYLEIYKSKNETFPSDLSLLIPALIALPEFKPYNYEYFEKDSNWQTKEAKDVEIWTGGFDIEDYEEAVLIAFYKDYIAQLNWYMQNKIYRRKKAMSKQAIGKFQSDQNITEIPSHDDDIINLYTQQPYYKNRLQNEV